MAKKFTWENSLEPERAEIKLKDLNDASHDIVFIEFPEPVLVDFIRDCLNISDAKEDEDGKPLTKPGAEGAEAVPLRYSVEEFLPRTSAPWNKYFAAATRGKKDEEFFESLEISTRMKSRLANAIMEINHVADIFNAGGNLALLPMVQKANEEASSASKSQLTATA